MKRRFALLAVPASFLLYLAAADSEFVGFGVDDGNYLLQARAFARGETYRVTAYFPIGYPALLALPVRLAPEVPEGILLYKALSALCAAAAVYVAFRVARDALGCGPRASLLVAVLCATNPRWVYFAGQVLSEAPYTLVSLVFFQVHLASRERPTRGRIAAVAVLAVAAVALRIIGVALLLGLLADRALELRRSRSRWVSGLGQQRPGSEAASASNDEADHAEAPDVGRTMRDLDSPVRPTGLSTPGLDRRARSEPRGRPGPSGSG